MVCDDITQYIYHFYDKPLNTKTIFGGKRGEMKFGGCDFCAFKKKRQSLSISAVTQMLRRNYSSIKRSKVVSVNIRRERDVTLGGVTACNVGGISKSRFRVFAGGTYGSN